MKSTAHPTARLLGATLLCALFGALSAAKAGTAADAPPLRPDGHRTPVDAAIPRYEAAPPLVGDLYIGGGMACTLIDQWGVIFKNAHPGVRVHTAIYAGSSTFGQLVEGPTQVCLLTREFLPYEREYLRLKAKNPNPVGFAVAGGGYSSEPLGCVPSQVILVNRDNPIPGLTLTQLDAIFSKHRNRGAKEDITRWGQLGLTGEWADKPIHVYNPNMPDGVPNFFRVYAMKEGEFKDTNQSQYEHPEALRQDRYAICLGKRGPGHVEEKRDPHARIVPLAETAAGPFTTGTYEEVLNRTYPLSRLIYLYVKTHAGKPLDPLAKEFIRVALSQEGQYEVARTLYMPLPASVVRENLARVQ